MYTLHLFGFDPVRRQAGFPFFALITTQQKNGCPKRNSRFYIIF